MMNKIFKYLIMLSVILISSCKKDDCSTTCIKGTFIYTPNCRTISGVIYLEKTIDSISVFTVAGKDIPGFMKKSYPVNICFEYEIYNGPLTHECSSGYALNILCAEKN